MPLSANVQALVDAGLINASNLPSASDIGTINGLSLSDIQAMIRVYSAVGTTFLTNNCNVQSPGPGPSRIIGIVF
jgi:hypothetical protein